MRNAQVLFDFKKKIIYEKAKKERIKWLLKFGPKASDLLTQMDVQLVPKEFYGINLRSSFNNQPVLFLDVRRAAIPQLHFRFSTFRFFDQIEYVIQLGDESMLLVSFLAFDNEMTFSEFVDVVQEFFIHPFVKIAKLHKNQLKYCEHLPKKGKRKGEKWALL